MASTSAVPSRAEYDCLLKFLVLGNTGVGKSCLLLRFADDTFTESHLPTLGVDFKFKSVTIADQIIRLQVWDTAGQERFRAITKSYYRNCVGFLLVYDVTRRDTFQSIQGWLADIKANASANYRAILIGNKTDMDGRVVSTEEGQTFAKQNGLPFIETSAKENTNVAAAFMDLATTIVEQKDIMTKLNPVSGSSRHVAVDQQIDIHSNPTKNGRSSKKSCC